MILTKLGKFFQWSDKIRVKVTTGQVGVDLGTEVPEGNKLGH